MTGSTCLNSRGLWYLLHRLFVRVLSYFDPRKFDFRFLKLATTSIIC